MKPARVAAGVVVAAIIASACQSSRSSSTNTTAAQGGSSPSGSSATTGRGPSQKATTTSVGASSTTTAASPSRTSACALVKKSEIDTALGGAATLETNATTTCVYRLGSSAATLNVTLFASATKDQFEQRAKAQKVQSAEKNLGDEAFSAVTGAGASVNALKGSVEVEVSLFLGRPAAATDVQKLRTVAATVLSNV